MEKIAWNGEQMEMKACMVVYSLYSMDARVKKYVKTLKEAGWEVHVISLYEDAGHREKVFYCGRKYQGNSTMKYILSYFSFFIKALLKLSINFLKYKYKIIHVHNMPDFLVFTAIVPRLLGTKIILDMHDSMPELFSVKFNIAKSHFLIKLLKLQELISANFSDCVIVVNHPQRELVKSHGIYSKKIEVIMNVAEEKIFSLQKRRRKQKKDFILVYHGTISRRLGIETAIKAVALVKEKIKNLKFYIYGAGEYLEEAIKLTDYLKLNEIVYFSKKFIPVEELPDVLEKADVGIVPTERNEYAEYMLPVKLLEYVAMGIPVVCSRLKTIEYYFSPSQVRYFKPGDENDLAKAILFFYNNPQARKEYAERAREFSRIYNWKNEKERYLALVRKLAR